MNRIAHPHVTTTLVAAALAAVVGCSADGFDEFLGTTSEDVEDNIEKEQGGLTYTDEEPLDTAELDALAPDGRDFDDPYASEERDELILDRTTDTVASDRARDYDGLPSDVTDRWSHDVRPGAGADGTVDPDAFHVQLLWGPFAHDGAATDEARDWTGELSVNRGTLVVRRLLRFEDTDELVRDERRDVVVLRSNTGPGLDGLRLTVIDPEADSNEPLILSYTRQSPDIVAGEDSVIRIDLRELVRGGGMRFQVGERDAFAAEALRRPRDRECAHGFTRGAWTRVGDRGGVLFGRVFGARDGHIGSIRGLWGIRENGDRVVFGKYINQQGAFRGVFAGTYEPGQDGEFGRFRARWFHRSGSVGKMAGRYDRRTNVDRIDGMFVGRWAEFGCATDGN